MPSRQELAEAGIESHKAMDAASAIFVLVMLAALAELVENTVPRGAKLPSLLRSWRGVLQRREEETFRSWARPKFHCVQCLLIVNWALWWKVFHPMGHGVSWGGRVYNGLVPNLLVCTIAVRFFFRQQWQSRAFDDIDTLELWLAWACAVGIPTINTAFFLCCRGGGHPLHHHNFLPLHPSKQIDVIDVEMLGGAEVYATFVVVGAALSMQTFELRTKLAVIVGNL